MKHINEIICIPLKHICDMSFQHGIFPFELKIANVVTIFKTSDEMAFSNCKLVSVLPVFSKLLERLVYDRLIAYITNYCKNTSLDFRREIYSSRFDIIG